MNEIRVPSKVVSVWKDDGGWWCALDDGRVYWAEFNSVLKCGEWKPFVSAVEDR